MSVRCKLTDVMKKRRISNAELCRRLARKGHVWSPSTISRWRKRGWKCLEEIAVLCDELHCVVADLIEVDSSPPTTPTKNAPPTLRFPFDEDDR